MPKPVLRAVLGRMQFALHATRGTPHGASHWVQAMSAWLVKTRRAPCRHSRDARVCGHTTTAMHNLSTPPTPAHRCLNSPGRYWCQSRVSRGGHQTRSLPPWTFPPPPRPPLPLRPYHRRRHHQRHRSLFPRFLPLLAFRPQIVSRLTALIRVLHGHFRSRSHPRRRYR